MDLNFNNYICSVIALSLINPSNFWGAVQRVVRGYSLIHGSAALPLPSFFPASRENFVKKYFHYKNNS